MDYGLIGEKLGHSFSKEIHNAFFNMHNQSNNYNLIEIEKNNLKKDFLNIMKNEYVGINVTVPYKENILKYVDEISNVAKEIGAINTVSFSYSGVLGDNTDYGGFIKMLDYYNVDAKGKNIYILGTGGASKAIVHALKNKGAKNIVFVSRSDVKEKDDLEVITYNDLEKISYKDIIIQGTPVGMYPNILKSPIEKDVLGQCGVAIDLIYNPKETRFLKYAKENGANIFNGLYMLVSQAILSQEIWQKIPYSSKTVENIYHLLNKKMA